MLSLLRLYLASIRSLTHMPVLGNFLKEIERVMMSPSWTCQLHQNSMNILTVAMIFASGFIQQSIIDELFSQSET